MKRFFRIFIVIVASFLFVETLHAKTLYAIDALIIATEEYPPYEYKEDGVLKGLDIEIIQAASERLGIKVKVKFLPWARAMNNVRLGKNDAMFPMFRTSEREKFLYFTTEHLGHEKNILITNKESTRQARSLEDLAGWEIGIARDNSYGKEFDEYKNIQRHEVTNIKQLIKMAAIGNRFDAATVNELVFAYIVKELGMAGRFKKLDFVVTNQPLYIGFSKAKGKSHKQLAEDYSRVLKQLREEGVIENIIQKYTSF